MNILIIEDDCFFAKHLSKALRSNPLVHRVDVVYSFNEFLEVFSALEGYDIILTDILLHLSCKSGCSGEFDGFHVIRTVRDASIHIPIIVISGRDDITRIQKAFEIGANDYIVKGIRMKELELRVIHWFRYYHFTYSQLNLEEHEYFYHSLSYNILKNEFFLNNNVIPLTRSTKNVLRIFFLHAEKLLSESFLMSKIWGDISLHVQRNIRIHISRLRSALSPFHLDTWIQTIHGEGYIFLGKD